MALSKVKEDLGSRPEHLARLNSTPCDTSMAESGREHGPLNIALLLPGFL